MGSERRILVAQFFRFNLVGILTVILGTAVFLAMIFLGFNYVLALTGDYAAGIVFSYVMNKDYTFKAKVASHARPFAMTVLSYALTFLLNVLLLALAVEALDLNVVVSQIVIMALLSVLNFLMFKYLVFRTVAD